MSDWVVMTLGLSPLPCLVEAYRLCCIVKASTKAWPNFLVFTRKDDVDAAVVEKKLAERLLRDGESAVTPRLMECRLTDPHNPITVVKEAMAAIRSKVSGSVPPRIHFPYTGGTKAMSMHVHDALLVLVAEQRVQKPVLSYLHWKDHKLMSTETGCHSPQSGERSSWHLHVQDLADLHALELVATNTVTAEVSAVSRRMLSLLLDGDERRQYNDWLWEVWDAVFPASVPIRDLRHWPVNRLVPWYRGKSPDWPSFSDELATVPLFGGTQVFRRRPDGTWSIWVDESVKRFVIPLHEYLHHQALEVYVFDALRRLLPDEEVQHSVHLRERRSGREMELDVTAVLGYELVALSCTLSDDRDTCKRKGFEVLHRAARLGGAHARAGLVCLLKDTDCRLLEQELNDDIATDPAGFRVFGKTFLDDAAGRGQRIVTAFDCYLHKELDWKITAARTPQTG